jgi:FtsP/CotA-like multicopper oxidase with cupredoxin domain
MKKKTLALSILLYTVTTFAHKTVRYDLYVADTIVNYTGEPKSAIAINGSIPAPTLYFTEGDTALIYVHNKMNRETSIHWHGLILPNEQDGVPYLTSAPIKAKATHIYKFPIKQSGTYWYHSHAGLQEQSGMYGAFIIYKKDEIKMPEYTMVLSDWTDAKPKEIHRSLRTANDWYAIKKGSTQSYGEAIKKGYFGQRLKSDWLRMTPMDVSDVYYNAFLLNGKTKQNLPQLKAGDKIKLRVINGSASTYFWLQFAGSKLKVVASDGADVVPVEVDRMIIGVAETYDMILTVPENMRYEFKATAEDRTKSTSLWLGDGMEMPAPTLPKLNYFEGLKMMNGMMKMNGTMDNMGMSMSNQVMDMNSVMYPELSGGGMDMGGMDMSDMPGMNMKTDTSQSIVTLNYSMLRSPVKTTLPNAPTKVLHFKLTGNMIRYLWTLDYKTVSESDRIIIKKGENVKIILENGSMMRHPMHLHGHFFRVLNGQGDYAPLKNVLDILPMETDTIEFAGTESGDWFFHCHILYHMMSGMGRIFTYENSPANPQLPNPKKAARKLNMDDKAWHAMSHIGLESNGSDGEFMLSNKRNFATTEWRLGVNDQMGYESESHVGRYIGRNQFFKPYIGWDVRYRKNGYYNPNGGDNAFGLTNTKNNRQVACIGFQYTLPFFIIADARLDHTGRFRFQLSREDIPITKRLRLTGLINSDLEYLIRARYILTKYFSISTHYDSDMKLGAGITIVY